MFRPATIEVFMGGEFEIGQPKTVGELRRVLEAILKETASWGDDTRISETWAHRNMLRVTLAEGLHGE